MGCFFVPQNQLYSQQIWYLMQLQHQKSHDTKNIHHLLAVHKTCRTFMFCIFSCLIKFYLAIVPFRVAISMTATLPLAVLLYECSRAWSIGTALHLVVIAERKNLLPWIFHITLELFPIVLSNRQNTVVPSGVPLWKADKGSDQLFSLNECVKPHKTGTILLRQTLQSSNTLDFCDSCLKNSTSCPSEPDLCTDSVALTTMLLFKLSFVTAHWNSLLWKR